MHEQKRPGRMTQAAKQQDDGEYSIQKSHRMLPSTSILACLVGNLLRTQDPCFNVRRGRGSIAPGQIDPPRRPHREERPVPLQASGHRQAASLVESAHAPGAPCREHDALLRPFRCPARCATPASVSRLLLASGYCAGPTISKEKAPQAGRRNHDVQDLGEA